MCRRFLTSRFVERTLIFLFLNIAIVTHVAAQSNQPNVIYIMADDLAYADLSCYGRKDYFTPNIEGLASQGMKFFNAYAEGKWHLGFLRERAPNANGFDEFLVIQEPDCHLFSSRDRRRTNVYRKADSI